MAERRMFAKTIIDSDAFLDMPQSTQLLYFQLAMRADDDGFINNPKSIMRNVRCNEDDIKVLIAKKFVIPFESGVIVIKHWRIHNLVRTDRYNETKYIEEKSTLFLDENGAYTQTIDKATMLPPSADSDGKPTMLDGGKPLVNHRLTQVRLGKDSIGKNKKEKINKKEKAFVPPTYEQVLEYAQSRGRDDIARKFYDYFSTGDWVDSKGQKVRNWKQKFITWEGHNAKSQTTTEVKSASDEIRDKQVEELLKLFGGE